MTSWCQFYKNERSRWTFPPLPTSYVDVLLKSFKNLSVSLVPSFHILEWQKQTDDCRGGNREVKLGRRRVFCPLFPSISCRGNLKLSKSKSPGFKELHLKSDLGWIRSLEDKGNPPTKNGIHELFSVRFTLWTYFFPPTTSISPEEARTEALANLIFYDLVKLKLNCISLWSGTIFTSMRLPFFYYFWTEHPKNVCPWRSRLCWPSGKRQREPHQIHIFMLHSLLNVHNLPSTHTPETLLEPLLVLWQKRTHLLGYRAKPLQISLEHEVRKVVNGTHFESGGSANS